MLLSKTQSEDLEDYVDYSNRKINEATEHLFSAISKIKNSSMKVKDKEIFKNNAIKLLDSLI